MQAKTETQPALHPAICDTHLTRSRKSARLELAGLKRLVLTGFMGAGKSTVGRLLAERLGWEFLDLDVLVESRSGLTVPEIFATRGEAHFRRLETQELAAALGRGNIVLALGGGAPESLTNRLLLEQTPATETVFLDASFATLFDRCMLQALNAPPVTTAIATQPDQLRPLLADPANAEARFVARRPIYRRLARLAVDTSALSTEETVDAILSAFSRGSSANT
jgi:shikimate kinase